MHCPSAAKTWGNGGFRQRRGETAGSGRAFPFPSISLGNHREPRCHRAQSDFGSSKLLAGFLSGAPAGRGQVSREGRPQVGVWSRRHPPAMSGRSDAGKAATSRNAVLKTLSGLEFNNQFHALFILLFTEFSDKRIPSKSLFMLDVSS